jgi:hypothetical protein
MPAGKVVHPPQLDGAMEVGGCSCAVRMNYYPPLRSDEVAQSPGDEGGGRGGSNGGVVQGRLLGHEDVTMFTLLPAPRGEGLEVLNRRNMRWVKLAAPPGSIILNTGDYMQRISADRYARRFHPLRSVLAEIYLCPTCFVLRNIETPSILRPAGCDPLHTASRCPMLLRMGTKAIRLRLGGSRSHSTCTCGRTWCCRCCLTCARRGGPL